MKRVQHPHLRATFCGVSQSSREARYSFNSTKHLQPAQLRPDATNNAKQSMLSQSASRQNELLAGFVGSRVATDVDSALVIKAAFPAGSRYP